MSRAIAAIWSSGDTAASWRPVAAISQSIAGFLKELTREIANPYRPEKHYMRGPGPAWQAKYGKLPVKAG